MASIPILGEPLDVVTLGFAMAVVATVVIGKRLSQPPATPVAASLPAGAAGSGRSR